MTVRIPQALIDDLRREVELEGASTARQIRALEELFELFTHGRSRLRGTGYLDIPRYRAAYLRYHVPLNFARATCCLEATLRVWPQLRELRRVVDFGAGPGSATLASMAGLPPQPAREYALFDRSRAAMAVARRLAGVVGRTEGDERPALSTRVATLPRLPRLDEPALVWLAMVLNEMRVGERGGPSTLELADRLTDAVPPGSAVLMVEPAQRGAGRNLLLLRDALLAAGGWRVLAPCTHAEACPLLDERSRPWCHFHFQWEVPGWVREIAEPAGLLADGPRARASLAFLALARVDGRPRPPAAAQKRARIIGDRMAVRGGRRGVYACRAGRREVIVASETNIRRGDVVGVEHGQGYRVLLPWNAEARPRGEAGQKTDTAEGRTRRGKKKPSRGDQRGGRSRRPGKSSREGEQNDG